jgi:hypothetical protein
MAILFLVGIALCIAAMAMGVRADVRHREDDCSRSCKLRDANYIFVQECLCVRDSEVFRPLEGIDP